MNEHQSPKALNELGDAYFYGKGKDKNIETAYVYYKQAADMGNVRGLYNLAKYYFASKEKKRGKRFLEKAVENGYAPAMILLGKKHAEGFGFRKRRRKALKLYLKATKQNDVEALNLAGDAYLNGKGTFKSKKKALRYYQKSADHNDPKGMYHVGLLILDKTKKRKEPKRAIQWLEKSADKSYAPAIRALRKLYQKPHKAFKKRSDHFLRDMVFHYDEMLANTGDESALKRVARTYYEGSDIRDVNYKNAKKYWLRLMEKDIPEGHHGIGLLYYQGSQFPKDHKKAKQLFEYAADKGLTEAIVKMGDLYRLGHGVEQDYERAKSYYLEAAKTKNLDAVIRLGILHYRRHLLHAKKELARQYFKQATEKNDPRGFYWLAVLASEEGADEQRVTKLLQEAIDKGSTAAKFRLASIKVDRLNEGKLPKRKERKHHQEAKDLLIAYIEHPSHNEDNALAAMVMLADLLGDNLNGRDNDKAKRYWIEKSALAGHSPAMVRMFHMLKDTEPKQALKWLEKASQNDRDGMAAFTYGVLWLNGEMGFEEDKKQAKRYFEAAADKGHRKALEKLMMM